MGGLKAWMLAALRMRISSILDPLTCSVPALSSYCSTSGNSLSLRLEDEQIINHRHLHLHPQCRYAQVSATGGHDGYEERRYSRASSTSSWNDILGRASLRKFLSRILDGSPAAQDSDTMSLLLPQNTPAAPTYPLVGRYDLLRRQNASLTTPTTTTTITIASGPGGDQTTAPPSSPTTTTTVVVVPPPTPPTTTTTAVPPPPTTTAADPPPPPPTTQAAPPPPTTTAADPPPPPPTTQAAPPPPTTTAADPPPPTTQAAPPTVAPPAPPPTAAAPPTVQPAAITGSATIETVPAQPISTLATATITGPLVLTTSARGSVFVTTVTPPGGYVSELVLVTTTLPDGAAVTVTSYTIVTPRPLTVSAAPGGATGAPQLEGRAPGRAGAGRRRVLLLGAVVAAVALGGMLL